MIKFNKPANLNGAELLDELKTVGVFVEGVPYIDGNGELWLEISDADKNKASDVVSSHNGTIIAPEPTFAEKLASVGISLNDLKVALGI